MVTTPIIPGFHPDPSICRVGDDYYLVNSTFEYLPSVPIFHSLDLVAWEQIGNILTRGEQLTLASSSGRGVYAPTLRYHDGRFYLVTTNVDDVRNGQIIVSATDPSGPWSDPVRVPGTLGIDPDLSWDENGRCHLTWCSVMGGSPIVQAPIDIETGQMLAEPKALWPGTGLASPEGPHLYHRDGWWYLLLAEGGTERGHAVTVARSRSITGPFEGNPGNPILSHRSTTHPVQNTGHADFVELADGSWAAVYLGVRPGGSTPGYHVNGRETFLAGIRWEEGWPFFEEEHFDVPEQDRSFEDDFATDELHPRWIAPGIHPARIVHAAAGGGIRISAVEGEVSHRPLLCTRTEHPEWGASAVIDGGAGRLVLRLDDAHWAGVELHNGTVAARLRIGPLEQVLATATLPEPRGTVHTLGIRATRPERGPFDGGPVDTVELGVAEDGVFRVLASFDGRYLSTEVAGGFTGRVVGVEPTGTAGQTTLRHFSYRHTQGEKV